MSIRGKRPEIRNTPGMIPLQKAFTFNASSRSMRLRNVPHRRSVPEKRPDVIRKSSTTSPVSLTRTVSANCRSAPLKRRPFSAPRAVPAAGFGGDSGAAADRTAGATAAGGAAAVWAADCAAPAGAAIVAAPRSTAPAGQ